MRKVLLFFSVVLLLWSGSALAYPVLQLDIDGGVYYSGPSTDVYDTESIIYTGTDGSYTVYALLTPSGQATFDDYVNSSGYDAYLSVAVYPQVSTSSTLGSFTANGTSYDVTGDMLYGTPPREMEDLENDLQSHGVFDTYYFEIGFDWDISSTAASYDTADNPGGLLTPATDPEKTSYYVAFNIDQSLTSEFHSLHFDLYSADLDGNLKMDYVAPFSHDAQGSPVPEPATMLLLGSGLVGMAGVGRKKFKK